MIHSWLDLWRPEPAAPKPDPELSSDEADSLRQVYDKKAYRVGNLRLETLINKGMVNSTGLRLTEKGLEYLQKNPLTDERK